VMFSDLVGSTALSARMDPEDLRDVISAYQKCVAETVRRFGGFVAKYIGDLASGEKGRCTPSDLGLLY
jgi:class 3 adenylate cyclase